MVPEAEPGGVPVAARAKRRGAVRHALLLLTLFAGTACSDTPGGTRLPTDASPDRGGLPHGVALAALDAVRARNAQSILAAPNLVPFGAPLAPFIEARLHAIVNVAMHDALNAVTPRFARYADVGPVVSDANAIAAVLTAAHDALDGAVPAAHVAADAWHAEAIGALAGEAGLAHGIAVGHRAAAAILARRATDGVAAGGVAPYVPGTHAGDYQFSFPFNTPGFNFFGTGGFADASNWAGTVTPFVIRSASQFRVARPYGAASNADAVLTPQYTADFQEISTLGCSTCPARTSDQTQIALFWLENSPSGWNRIARIVAGQRHLDALESARLFAVLQMGEFDSYTAALESKYHYNFWRPVSAVALAATDGNPATTMTADWQVLAFPTPPVPDYPSAHSVAGGNAAAIIEALIPGCPITAEPSDRAGLNDPPVSGPVTSAPAAIVMPSANGATAGGVRSSVATAMMTKPRTPV